MIKFTNPPLSATIFKEKTIRMERVMTLSNAHLPSREHSEYCAIYSARPPDNPNSPSIFGTLNSATYNKESGHPKTILTASS